MMFEISQDYTNLLPMMITVAIADLVRNYFCSENIFTLQLKRRGYVLPHGLHTRFKKEE